jgi:hypothetical protein
MKTNLLLRVVTTFTAIVLVSASAWAANHQICYQVPPPAGTQRIFARFACRTDGVNPGNCQVQSIQPDFTIITDRPAPSAANDGRVEREVEFQGSAIVTATFQFADGSVRKCTVETFTFPQFSQGQDPTVQGFNTDQSGLVMSGLWIASSAAADVAFQQVGVPPDFIAVGGGAQGTEVPGTLVTTSISSSTRSWLAGVHSNVPAGSTLVGMTSGVIAFGIGLKIEGIPNLQLQALPQFPITVSTSVPHPHVTRTTDANGIDLSTVPQSVAVISGGVQAGPPASSPLGQYVTATEPLTVTRCYFGGACEQVVRGWFAESKDHINPSPGFVKAMVTTLPKVLTINGNTFHIETWVSQATSGVLAHPAAEATLPGDFALTGIGAFVDWNTLGAAGNLVFNLEPRFLTHSALAQSKDQWFSSPASITAFAIGMKLVPGPVPTICPAKYTWLFCATH